MPLAARLAAARLIGRYSHEESLFILATIQDNIRRLQVVDATVVMKADQDKTMFALLVRHRIC